MSQQLLEKIGLTRSEAEVYLSMLELGSSATGKIVDKSKASSSKIYEILDRLMQKGLASFIIKNGVKHFEAAPPDRIIDYLREREQELKKQEAQIADILPELRLKQQFSKFKSEATVYKGMKGMHAAFYSALDGMKAGDEMLLQGKPIRSETIERFFAKFHDTRSKRKIKVRAIMDSTATAFWKSSRKMNNLIQFKLVSQATPAAINIMNDSVIIFPEDETDEPIIFGIKNKQVADSFRVHFEAIWNQDVSVLEGQDHVTSFFNDMLSDLKKGEEYFVINANYGESETRSFFPKYHLERQKLGIKANLLLNSNMRDSYQDIVLQPSQHKFLSPDFKSPLQTIFYKDRLLLALWSKDPIGILIKRRDIVDAFKGYFDVLWNQDTTVAKGMDSLLTEMKSFLDGIEKDDTFDAYGTGFGIKSMNQEYAKTWKRFHDYRKNRGIKARWLFQQGISDLLEKNKDNYELGEIKFLPYKTESPVAMYSYKDRALIMVQGKEPTLISINNKDIADAFKIQFETVWNQDTNFYKGYTDVGEQFRIFMENVGKSSKSYNVLGGGFGIGDAVQKYVEFFRKIHTQRISLGINARMLFRIDSADVVEENSYIYNTLFEYKFIPQDGTIPSPIFCSEDTVMIMIQDAEPSLIVINKPEVASKFLNHFNSLWNQEVKVIKGVEGGKLAFREMLDSGNCDFIGARGYLMDREPEFIDWWQKEAMKRGFKMRNIVDPDVRTHRIAKYPFAKTKYSLKPEFVNLSVFWIYGDKVVISNWTEKEPIFIFIENKKIHDMYRKQFELLWNEDISSGTTTASVKMMYDDILESVTKEDDVIVFAARPKTKELADFNLEWNRKMSLKAKQVRLLYYGLNDENRERAKEISKVGPMTKIIDTKESLPISTVILRDTIINTVWDHEPKSFKIQNKTVADSYRANFELLWQK